MALNVFFPRDSNYHGLIKNLIVNLSEEQGIKFIGWRSIPVNNECLSKDKRDQM